MIVCLRKLWKNWRERETLIVSLIQIKIIRHILYWVTEYRYMYLIHMTWVRKHGSKSKQKNNFMLIVNRILMRRLFFLKGPMHNNFNEF